MMDFLPEPLRIAVLGVVAVLAGLFTLANAYPDVAWLRRFRVSQNQLTEQQKRRLRRSVNTTAGVQLIGIGLLLPVGYIVLNVMFFSAVDPRVLWLLVAGAAVCVFLGVVAIVKA